MAEYGTTEEDLAWVSVKNHRHGALNEHAQFQRELTTDQVLSSALVSEPLRLLNCSPVSDGAAAVLLCPLDQASQYTDRPVVIRGTAMATDVDGAGTDRRNISFLDSVAVGREPGRMKWPASAPNWWMWRKSTTASRSPRSAASRRSAWRLPGEGRHCARTGETALGGRLPVNTSGGLKSKGHPVGATGVAQAVELFEQLTGCFGGARQVPGARVRPRPEHGRDRRQLCRAHPSGHLSGEEVQTMPSPRYWREIPSRYRLEATRCGDCGRVSYPPRPASARRVEAPRRETIELSHEGRVVTSTVVHVPTGGFSHGSALCARRGGDARGRADDDAGGGL